MSIVHSVLAAIDVLRDRPAPPPFDIAGKKEALLILTHYIGDIHQPLHVEAIYLDAKGRTVDPDAIGAHPENETSGGNAIVDGAEKLHREWGRHSGEAGGRRGRLRQPRGAVANRRDDAGRLVDLAGAVGPRDHPRRPFRLHRASLRLEERGGGKPPLWTVTGTRTSAYRTRAEALKTTQLAAAGARLAQVLRAIWPDTP